MSARRPRAAGAFILGALNVMADKHWTGLLSDETLTPEKDGVTPGRVGAGRLRAGGGKYRPLTATS